MKVAVINKNTGDAEFYTSVSLSEYNFVNRQRSYLYRYEPIASDEPAPDSPERDAENYALWVDELIAWLYGS